MDPIERMVSRVLGIGIAVAVALMLTGLVLGLLDGEGIPTHVVALGDLLPGLREPDPVAYLSLGLLVLVATPFVRVAGSIVDVRAGAGPPLRAGDGGRARGDVPGRRAGQGLTGTAAGGRRTATGRRCA